MDSGGILKLAGYGGNCFMFFRQASDPFARPASESASWRQQQRRAAEPTARHREVLQPSGVMAARKADMTPTGDVLSDSPRTGIDDVGKGEHGPGIATAMTCRRDPGEEQGAHDPWG